MEQYARRIETRMVEDHDFPYAGTTLGEVQEVINFVSMLQDADTEKDIVLFLNGGLELICLKFYDGTVGCAPVFPREIAKLALLTGTTGVILVHNHPDSGQSAPSDADRIGTRLVKDALALFEIQLLDHIIIARDGYYSFREHDWNSHHHVLRHLTAAAHAKMPRSEKDREEK